MKLRLHSGIHKGRGKRGNIVAETLKRTQMFRRANGETFVIQKHFLRLGRKICVRNKTGKHLRPQQCFRHNVSSFATALSLVICGSVCG